MERKARPSSVVADMKSGGTDELCGNAEDQNITILDWILRGNTTADQQPQNTLSAIELVLCITPGNVGGDLSVNNFMTGAPFASAGSNTLFLAGAIRISNTFSNRFVYKITMRNIAVNPMNGANISSVTLYWDNGDGVLTGADVSLGSSNALSYDPINDIYTNNNINSTTNLLNGKTLLFGVSVLSPIAGRKFQLSIGGFALRTTNNTISNSGAGSLSGPVNPTNQIIQGTVSGIYAIVISEVVNSYLGDTACDYIELYNPTDTPVSLAGASVQRVQAAGGGKPQRPNRNH